MEISGLVKAELAATCGTLGRTNAAGKYIVDPQCFESIRDLIRFLRRDDSRHEVRLFLGNAKILATDLVPIVAASMDNHELFDIAIRLLVNLTNPVILLYKDELPAEKVGRNIYMRLIQCSQEYKTAFCNVDFWKAVMSKLTDLFEVDWSERSEDSSLQIERMLVLLRNVLQVPADSNQEQAPDNDITVHDKVLWALRESQLLEVLLYVASNKEEQKYFLHLLEIFSLVLREQSPQALAQCDVTKSDQEKKRDADELAELRQKEKFNSKCFRNSRSFPQTYVLKNVKSISENDVVYHKSIDKLNDLKLTQDTKRVKTPKNRFPEDSERIERRSAFSVRIFLKEFCVELLSCGFNHLMSIVKDKLVAGKALANDESYYFWALKFFLEFACTANVDVKLISECINVQTFHFVQTNIDNCYDHMSTDKKKLSTWIRRLHLNIKAYRSLLQTLSWMDSSKDPKVREASKVLKSNLFYVPEYREVTISCLFKYDSGKFPLSFLRDLIETNHIFLRLLENYCKTSSIVVQRNKRVMKKRAKKPQVPKEVPPPETPEDKWNKIKDEIYDLVEKNIDIPEIVPFDATSTVPIDDQKEDAMKNVQKRLRSGEAREAVGLLRSSRQVWPENDIFGSSTISVEDEVMVLQEICLTDLGVEYPVIRPEAEEEEESDEDSEEEQMEVIEHNYDIEDYLKKLAHKKIVEGACLLLGNYRKNSANTNHCALKLLFRIGWQCKVPAMMYQASFFITLNNILSERNPAYKEIQHFAKQLLKKFRDNAKTNPKIFMELLFWKEPKIAVEIEEGYGTSEAKETKGTWSEEEEDELRKLWVEFDEQMLDTDKVDWIKGNLINQERSRLSVLKKLKQLMLIAPGTRVAKKRKGAEWSEDEIALLTKLFEEHKNASDVTEMIRIRMMARSKKSIKDKMIEIGLVNSLADLRKKRVGKTGKSRSALSLSPTKSSSSEESAAEEEEYHLSVAEAVPALRNVETMKEALEWLKETFTECINDEDESEGYPLLPLDKTCADALEHEGFKEMLRKMNISEPKDGQIYWKVRGDKMEVHEALELVKAAIDGKLDDVVVPPKNSRRVVSEDSDSEDELEKLPRTLPGARNKVKESSIQSGSENRNDGASESSGSEDEFEKFRRSLPGAKNKKLGKTIATQNGSENGKDSEDPFDQLRKESLPENGKKSGNARRLVSSDSESEISERRQTSHTIDSDRSNKEGPSGDDDSPVKKPQKVKSKRKTPSRRAGHLGSDDSDTGSETQVKRGPVASDSDGEVAPPSDYWRHKRRRCIGSDSEIEGEASGEEMRSAPREVRKKSRLLDSDSEVEGHGSMEDVR